MTDQLSIGAWFAAYTRPHREHAAAMNISRFGLEVFLPLLSRERGAAARLARMIRLLLPGYLFARFNPATYLHLIRYACGVKSGVSAGNTPLPVSDEIIATIRSHVDRDGFARLERTPANGSSTAKAPFRG